MCASFCNEVCLYHTGAWWLGHSRQKRACDTLRPNNAEGLKTSCSCCLVEIQGKALGIGGSVGNPAVRAELRGAVVDSQRAGFYPSKVAAELGMSIRTTARRVARF
jgi:hypothetical protein